MSSRFIVLSVVVEVSDQLGTSKEYVAGIFDNYHDLNAAMLDLDNQVFKTKRCVFREHWLEVNKVRKIFPE